MKDISKILIKQNVDYSYCDVYLCTKSGNFTSEQDIPPSKTYNGIRENIRMKYLSDYFPNTLIINKKMDTVVVLIELCKGKYVIKNKDGIIAIISKYFYDKYRKFNYNFK